MAGDQRLRGVASVARTRGRSANVKTPDLESPATITNRVWHSTRTSDRCRRFVERGYALGANQS